MARYRRPSSVTSLSKIVTIDGWLETAAMRSASAANASRVVPSDHWGSRTLIATCLRGRSSW